MLVNLLFLTLVGCRGEPAEDPSNDPYVAEANRGIAQNEEKTQALLANLHNRVQNDVDRINAKINRPGEPGVVPSSLMQIDPDEPTLIDPDSDDGMAQAESMSNTDVLKASFDQMTKDRASMRSMDKEAKEDLHAFRRGKKEAQQLLSHVELIRDLRHKKHEWREQRVAARVRAAQQQQQQQQPSSFLEEKAKKAEFSPLDDSSDEMLKEFMHKMTAQKEEYDEERKHAEEETAKARAELARAQQQYVGPSSLLQTLPDLAQPSDNLGDVEKTLGQLQGRMRDQLNQFTAVGRKDQLEEELELKRMKRAFPGSLAQTEAEHFPRATGRHRHRHERTQAHHHYVSPPLHDPRGIHHHHATPDQDGPLVFDPGRGPDRHSHRMPHVHHSFVQASPDLPASTQPVLDDSKLNADLAAFSDATNELGKEENQMKTDAAKFAADMDAATVNAGSFIQLADHSDEPDRTPSSLAEMGETTALSEWRRKMEARQQQMKERREEDEKMLHDFDPLGNNHKAVSFLETGSKKTKDLPDFGSDDIDGASSDADIPSFGHSSDSLDTPDFSSPSDSDTDSDSSLSPHLPHFGGSGTFGDSSLDDPSPSTDFGGSSFGHDDASSFGHDDASAFDSGLGSAPDFSSPSSDFGSSSSSDDSTESSFTPSEPSADFGSTSDDAFSSSLPSFSPPSFDASDTMDASEPFSLMETKAKTKVDAKAAKAKTAAKMTRISKTKSMLAKRHEPEDPAHLRRK